MSTDNAIRAEATYRITRATGGARRADLRRTLPTIVWRPSSIAAMIAAGRRATTVDGAVHDALAAARIPTTLERV